MRPYKVYCDISDCTKDGGNFYYYVWNDTFVFNIKNEFNWYSKDLSGSFISKNDYNDLSDKTGYIDNGTGVPIDITTKSGKDNVSVDVSLHNFSDTINCPFEVENKILKCLNGDCTDSKNITKEFNFDFRIIDTNDPFPGISGTGRNTGDNWCGPAIDKAKVINGKVRLIGDINGDGKVDSDDATLISKYDSGLVTLTDEQKELADINNDGRINIADGLMVSRACLSNNTLVKEKIIDAPNSYSTDTPMYSFTLTPSDIKNIRNYNKEHAYNDFDMTCDSNGEYCLSKFLTDWIQKGTVNGQSVSTKLSASNSSCYTNRVKTTGNNVDKWCSN